MKILVTGANGQLGRSMRKNSGDYPQHTFIFTDVPELDITDKRQFGDFARQNAVQAIVNCAAYTAVDKAETEQELAERINCQGTRVLGETAKELNIPLVHISTDYVFCGEGCHPLKETDPTAPTGVYGSTKLHGEKALESIGCDVAIIRTAWLYSEFGGNFVKTMLRVATERDTLNVVYDQVGSPTYATDLARALMKVLDSGIKGLNIYHFSNEGAVSWYDFAKAIFEESNINIIVNPIESDKYPSPVKRPSYSVLSKEKIKSIGVDVPYWRDSLKICLKALKSQQ
ncbi:MAG: dTDP-4-dehydrorhamnose reductase [Bacteroidales bacterium]|nr:dTDP-4-dehydrorhamnose reductase [Bacteroidales bacterium]